MEKDEATDLKEVVFGKPEASTRADTSILFIKIEKIWHCEVPDRLEAQGYEILLMICFISLSSRSRVLYPEYHTSCKHFRATPETGNCESPIITL